MLKKQISYITLILLLTNVLSYGNITSSGKLKNVLVLHSYNDGLSWTDNINKGIFDSFKDSYHRTVDLRIEYLDAKHLENTSDYKDFLYRKYKNVPIDVIISSDNAAFDFLISTQTEIFNQAPVVFCGVNYCDSIPKGFTGVMEDVSIKNNLNNILKLHPNYHKLYIINDLSITGRSINKELLKVIHETFPNLKYEVLTNYTLDELKIKLSSLEKEDVALMILFNFDRLGRPISYDIILEELMPTCKIPMYGLWDFYLGEGIVGGTLSNGYDHGVEACKMAKAILNGKSVDSIPVIAGPTTNYYDYKVLKQHNINTSLLPENSIIINSPFEFIRKNQLFYSLLAVIFTLLIALIFILIYLNQRAKRTLTQERATAEIIKAKSEELVSALESVERANKLKTAFLCNLSHEIRTPMNGILGFTTIMECEEEAQNQSEYIELINTNAKNLLTVINDIMEISQIESHLVQIEENQISINDILTQSVSEYKDLALAKNISISLRLLLPKQEAIITSDSNKIIKAINNLLSNAIKFSDSGTITIGYIKEENQFLFYCKDEGIGIDPQHIEHIFEPFRKAEQSNHKIYAGNGLGLAITKAHIELLGGKIWVESTPLKGSAFYFTIPI